MKKLAYCLVAFVLLFSVMLVTNSYAHDYWKVKWEYKGAEVSGNDPDLKHYIWETARPPYGAWDKIQLHRFIRQKFNWDADPYRPSHDPRKVLFIIPGTYDRGFTKLSDIRTSENWFFAANGYDVYSIEFRTAFMPNLAQNQFAQPEFGLANELKATAEWTYDIFREDIKACVELAKRLSGGQKLFLAGRSRGGTQTWMYSAKYAKDLKGLISLDGGVPYVLRNPSAQMTQAAFQANVAALKASGPYMGEVGAYELGQFAWAVPFATTSVGGPLPPVAALTFPPGTPSDKAQMKYVSDLVAYGYYYSSGPGIITNYYALYPGGNGETYMDRATLVGIAGNFTRYWPHIQDLEGAAITNYGPNDTTPFGFDYNLTGKVNLPVLSFAGELTCTVFKACWEFGSPVPAGASYVPRTASNDVTDIYLHHYGHLDVYGGTHSLQDVKQPMLEWMNQRLGHH
jgi:pimeloyl-ACP methyl ester carboxylesterase